MKCPACGTEAEVVRTFVVRDRNKRARVAESRCPNCGRWMGLKEIARWENRERQDEVQSV